MLAFSSHTIEEFEEFALRALQVDLRQSFMIFSTHQQVSI